jgi:hypothetical protein
VQLIDAKERLRLLERSALREVVILKESSMPSYKDRLTPQEQADVVSFLTTLRGRR